MAEPLRLYLWIYGADDLVPSQLQGRAAKRHPPSVRALAEAAVACGRTEFHVQGDAISGQEVSLPSGTDDRRLVLCMQARTGFDFNATVATESDWNSRHTRAGAPLEIE